MSKCIKLTDTTSSIAGRIAYRAVNPQSGTDLPGEYFYATSDDVADAMNAAAQAHLSLNRISLDTRGSFLRAVADQLVANSCEIVSRCSLETGLPVEPRLNGEIARVIGVLRAFAEMVITGGVSDCHIVTRMPERQPKARPDLRTRRIGIGPVLVVEPANFPLAFGVVGGDTISAWAAGCPVVAKVHPGHPGTSELMAQCVFRAAAETGIPRSIFSLLHGGVRETEMLVANESLRGVAFTGSRAAGMAIHKLVAFRKRPLDTLSLEMGSVNPLFVFPGALGEKSQELANGLSSAALLGCGQFCTKPGLVFYPDSLGGDFEDSLVELFREQSAQLLLGPKYRESYLSRISEVENVSGVNCLARGKDPEHFLDGCYVSAGLFKTDVETFFSNSNLREEMFGPAVLLVACPVEDFTRVAQSFEGELTASLHGTQEELCAAGEMVNILELRVGRILFNGYPPGVEVCDAMNHSGPWPAGLGNVTVVGPSSINRWLRPICYQDAPQGVLPEDVRDDAPTGLGRTVDGIINATR